MTGQIDLNPVNLITCEGFVLTLLVIFIFRASGSGLNFLRNFASTNDLVNLLKSLIILSKTSISEE